MKSPPMYHEGMQHLQDRFGTRTLAGAQLLVEVTVAHASPNCPRYIHQWTLAETSQFVPKSDAPPTVPQWKVAPDIIDALPDDDPARRGG